MSKAAKQSIVILIFLLLCSLGFAGYTFLEAEKLKKDKAGLQQQLNQSQDREKRYITEAQSLKDQVAKAQEESSKIQAKVKKAEKEAEELLVQVNSFVEERSKLNKRVEGITKERDELIKKASDLEIALDKALDSSKNTPSMMEKSPPKEMSFPQNDDEEMESFSKDHPHMTDESMSAETGSRPQDEQYWASVLKAKAALEVQIENLKGELSKNSIDIVELKQKNDNLQLELDGLKHDKEKLEKDIVFKEDLVNNLSLELAKAKNDKKFILDNVSGLDEENQELRAQLKQLVATKGALEKTIVRLTEDKNTIQKKLEETENIMQSKIDEIWEVKDSLNETFKPGTSPSNSEIELSPIVVNSDKTSAVMAEEHPGLNAKVISLNDENNFVIVDAGEAEGVSLGNTLTVYRDSKYIARLEVIQVRKDISAADIKDQQTKIKVGDVIR